jgi:hypothetical protein
MVKQGQRRRSARLQGAEAIEEDIVCAEQEMSGIDLKMVSLVPLVTRLEFPVPSAPKRRPVQSKALSEITVDKNSKEKSPPVTKSVVKSKKVPVKGKGKITTRGQKRKKQLEDQDEEKSELNLCHICKTEFSCSEELAVRYFLFDDKYRSLFEVISCGVTGKFSV